MKIFTQVLSVILLSILCTAAATALAWICVYIVVFVVNGGLGIEIPNAVYLAECHSFLHSFDREDSCRRAWE